MKCCILYSITVLLQGSLKIYQRLSVSYITVLWLDNSGGSWAPPRFPINTKHFFQVEINIINVFFFSSSRFVWIPLWVYYRYTFCNSFSAGIVFRRKNLTSTDVKCWPTKIYFWTSICDTRPSTSRVSDSWKSDIYTWRGFNHQVTLGVSSPLFQVRYFYHTKGDNVFCQKTVSEKTIQKNIVCSAKRQYLKS